MNTIEHSLTEAQITSVQDILMRQLGVAREQITVEADIQGDLLADSLDIVEITMEVEECFSIEISDAEGDKVKTVGDLYETLAEHLQGAR